MLTETKKKLTRAEAVRLAGSYRLFLDELAARLKPAWRINDKPAPIFTWRTFVAPDPCLVAQGWKIHISAAAVEAMELCEIVVNLLVRRRATFKLPTTAESIAAINSGLAGDVQVGKVITVYPRSDQETQELVHALEHEWPTSLGPNVSSDLVTSEGGAIFLRYGSFGGGHTVVDSAGRQSYALHRQDGSLVADFRSPMGLQPEWAPAPPVACTQIAEDNEAKVTVAGREYLPLMLLHQSARGKVTLALDLQNGANVVLKTASKGTCGDLTGVDAGDRLRNEHDILQQLVDLDRLAPRCLGINQSSTTVLVMEDLEGTSLDKLPRPEQISSLAPLADALSRLHACHVVHRDIKLSNCVREGRSIRLIDFELAAFAGEMPAIADCGTRNYIPPEGAQQEASAAGDVYALGICICHALLGHDPAVLPHGAGRLVGLLSLLSCPGYARLVKRLLHADMNCRPSAEQTGIELRNLSLTAHAVPGCTKTRKPLRRFNRYKRIAIEAGLATRNFVEPMAHGRAWRNFHSESECLCEGISLGASGILLGLATIDQTLGRRMFDEDIRQGANWLCSRNPGTANGLFTGNAGVAVALATAGKRLQAAQAVEGARSRLAATVSTSSNAFDLLAGSAGIIWAGVLLADLLELAWPLEYVESRARDLIQTIEEKHGVLVWDSHVAGEAGNTYTGAAHGSAGIAMALAGWGQRAGNVKAIDLASTVFRLIARVSIEHHNQKFPGILANKASYSPPGHWCHGITGYLWCLLQAFGDDGSWNTEIDWAVQQLSAALPVGNATYCHGLAGQLEVWRMLQHVSRHSSLAKSKADELAIALNLLVQRRHGSRLWCSEEPATVTPDLWLGFLGPACGLAFHSTGLRHALLSPAWLQQLSQPPTSNLR